MKALLFALCLLLALPGGALGAQPHAPEPPAAAKAKPKAKRKAGPKTAAPPASALTREELLSPYTALRRQTVGPTNAEGRAEARQGQGRPDLQESYQSNATSWKVDVSLEPKRPQDDSPLRLRLGREETLDPVTGKQISPRADPLGATESLKQLDFKNTLDKMRGKAEVQVDVLRF